MEIIYRAKDGKEFNDRYECQKYELELDLNNSNYKLFDANMQPTSDPENVWYAKFNSYEDIQAFNRLCDEEGIYGVECDIDYTKPLVFYYNENIIEGIEGNYRQYGVEVEKLEKELSDLKEQYEKLLSM